MVMFIYARRLLRFQVLPDKRKLILSVYDALMSGTVRVFLKQPRSTTVRIFVLLHVRAK